MSLQPTSIGLMGFSQGGAMALQLMRTCPEMFAYAVNLAGFVVDDRQPGDTTLVKLRPPILWSRGRHDSVIPDRALERTSAWMSSHCSGTIRTYDHLGHDVAGQQVHDFAAFIHAQTVRLDRAARHQ